MDYDITLKKTIRWILRSKCLGFDGDSKVLNIFQAVFLPSLCNILSPNDSRFLVLALLEMILKWVSRLQSDVSYTPISYTVCKGNIPFPSEVS